MIINILNKLKFTLCWIFFTTISFAQSYRVQSYNIEQGLPQTQVNALCEDKTGHIWAATLGGLTRFDGLNFTNLTEQHGAPSNTFYNAIADNKGNVWLSSESGLSKYNGRNFKPFLLSDNRLKNIPIDILADQNAHVWANTRAGGVFQIIDNQIVKFNYFNGFTDSVVARIGQATNANAVWFATVKDGLWRYENNVFTKISYPTSKILVEKILFDQHQNPVLLTLKGVYLLQQNQLQFLPFPNLIQEVTTGIFLPNGDCLLGTRNGLFRYNNKQEISYLSDNEELNQASVRDIELDSEENIWIATDGQGIFKASPTAVSIVVNKKQIQTPAVMTICKDNKDRMWFGTYNGGLYRSTQNLVERINLPSKDIICSHSDENGQLWLGTDNDGIFIIDNQKIINIKKEKGLPSNRIYAFAKEPNGKLWILTQRGLCFYKNNIFTTINDNRFSDISISSLLVLGKDSLLFSCKSGLYLIQNQAITPFLEKENLSKKAAFCMAKDPRNNIWFGTMGSGLFCWQTKLQKALQFTTEQGLESDIIYSLYAESNGTIWAGTGKGFHRLTLAENGHLAVKIFGQNEGITGLESNQNAIFYDNEKILFGTTRGLYEVNTTAIPSNKNAPKLALRAVRLFYDDKEILKYGKDTSPYYSVPYQLSLPTYQNHLTFDFIGISHTHPEGVRYRYLIEGLDKDWSPITEKTSATYSEIPPGKYSFKLMACNSDGIWTSEPLSYPFQVQTPFHQTVFFQILVLFGLIGFGAGIQAIRGRMKLNRASLILRLREEEQNKIRQKTAEDFHDELGNKLTRISILTDIIETKLDAKNTDLQALVRQIKDNTKDLYNGTKDILWSLHPESDNLYGTVQRLHDFSIELFSETDIDFQPPKVAESFKTIHLQMDYSRNIQMICKETLNNILRHAKAKNVFFDIELKDNILIISIKDDGIGFDINAKHKGNGLHNMQLRAERIGAYFQLMSQGKNGTALKVQLDIHI